MPGAARWSAAIAAAWAGVLLCIAAIAAPSAFATLAPADAGRFAGRLFAAEAYLSLGLALLLFFLERRRAQLAADAGSGSVFSAGMLLLLGTLFCTVAGFFALEPMLAAARLGQGALSFGLLHAVAGGFYALKGVLVLALVWRLARV